MFWWWEYLFPKYRVVRFHGGYVAQVRETFGWRGIDKSDVNKTWNNYQGDYCVCKTEKQAKYLIEQHKVYN